MKDQETIQRFIELRSTGLSFARIAEQLHIARRTLIHWSRQYQFEIQNLRAIEWESFTDSILSSRRDRLQALQDRLRQMEAELATRDLATIPTAQLEIMAERLRRRVEREAGGMTFSSPDTEFAHENHPEQVQDWQP